MHLLDNYTFDARTRYENHTLYYTPTDSTPIEFRGILAAAVLCALLVDTEEGDARGIAIDTPEQREDFFTRYEKEVRRDNGGLLTTEIQTLNEANMEFTGDHAILAQICRNDRLYDLANGLMIEYMQRLVREEVCEQIYDLEPWKAPFAQWLYDAGFVETRRQHLLSIDWNDPATVFAISEEITKNSIFMPEAQPLFVFEGLSAEQVLNGYWSWLWKTIQEDADLYPDARVRLAQYKQQILKNEIDYNFLKPEMKDFTPEQIKLFRSWMRQWKDFLEQQIEPPVSNRKKDTRQELFPDNITPIPPANDYSAVREYIHDRCQYDAEFRKMKKMYKLTEFCQQLTFIFDWPVEYNSLYKSLKRRLKHPRKNHLPK